jgi:hypothetical protein
MDPNFLWWYVLVVVENYSRYTWVFFLEDKGETFGFARDLVLRLKIERHGDVIRVIHSDSSTNLKTLTLKHAVVT